MCDRSASDPGTGQTFLGALLFSTLSLNALMGWYQLFNPNNKMSGIDLLVVLAKLTLTGCILAIPSVGLLFFTLRARYRRKKSDTLQTIFGPCLAYGVGFSLMNSWAIWMSGADRYNAAVFVEIPLLFVVSGGSAGLWMAWLFARARGVKVQFRLSYLLGAACFLALLLFAFSADSTTGLGRGFVFGF
ncbi:MAG: hypothetical protein L6R28_15305 [Planctomycetes bacterium]|nr:hypothetical protein [Planctomycetota bacterium]